MRADHTPDADLEELSQVIGCIYDCALDSDAWPKALAAIGDYIGGNRVRLFLFNADAGRPKDAESIGVDSDFNRAFDKDGETLATIKYGFVVADLDKAVTLGEILGVTGGRDVNGRLPHDNRFWREWMAPRGAHDALAVLTFKTRQRFGGLAMTRSEPWPTFSLAEKRKMELISPHVRRVVTISDLIASHARSQTQFAEVIDALAAPVMILGPGGRVQRINPAAGQLVESKAIIVRNGVLQGLAADDPAWAGGSVTLNGDGGASLIATLLPLSPAANGEATAIFIHQPGAPAQLPGESFAKLYGLTGTELRIALMLAEGEGPGDIAERLGSSSETIRWHLKNLRSKLGCSRISEVALLTTRAMSPLLPR